MNRLPQQPPMSRDDAKPSSETTEIQRAKWTIKPSGARHYIHRPDGTKASDGFHSIEAFSLPEGVSPEFLILGRCGAATSILVYDESSRTFNTSGDYHAVSYRSDLQLFVCTTGALSYVLDPVTGSCISKGYHSIERDGAGVWGRIGSTRELIEAAPKLLLSHSVSPSHALGLLMKQ